MTTYSEILIRSGENDTINALAGTLIAIVGTSGNADLSSSDWNNDLENVVDTPGVPYITFHLLLVEPHILWFKIGDALF